MIPKETLNDLYPSLLQTFRALALAVAGSLGLQGCATLPGQEPATQVSSVPRLVTTDYYANCYQPVEELRRYDVSARMAKRQEEARTAGILAGAAMALSPGLLWTVATGVAARYWAGWRAA